MARSSTLCNSIDVVYNLLPLRERYHLLYAHRLLRSRGVAGVSVVLAADSFHVQLAALLLADLRGVRVAVERWKQIRWLVVKHERRQIHSVDFNLLELRLANVLLALRRLEICSWLVLLAVLLGCSPLHILSLFLVSLLVIAASPLRLRLWLAGRLVYWSALAERPQELLVVCVVELTRFLLLLLLLLLRTLRCPVAQLVCER